MSKKNIHDDLKSPLKYLNAFYNYLRPDFLHITQPKYITTNQIQKQMRILMFSIKPDFPSVKEYHISQKNCLENAVIFHKNVLFPLSNEFIIIFK